MLVLLGAALGVWETFLVPLRLPGGIEGLADVLALAGNLAAGVLAARALRDVTAAAMPGIGWLLGVLVVSTFVRPANEVVIPGTFTVDPGIAWVGKLLLVAGSVGAILAIVLAAVFTLRANRPTYPR